MECGNSGTVTAGGVTPFATSRYISISPYLLGFQWGNRAIPAWHSQIHSRLPPLGL